MQPPLQREFNNRKSVYHNNKSFAKENLTFIQGTIVKLGTYFLLVLLNCFLTFKNLSKQVFHFGLKRTLDIASYKLQIKKLSKVNLVSGNPKIVKSKSMRNFSFGRTSPLPTLKFEKNYSINLIYSIAKFVNFSSLLCYYATELFGKSTNKLLDVNSHPFSVLADEYFYKHNILGSNLDSHVLLTNFVFICAGPQAGSEQYYVSGSCRSHDIWEDVSERNVNNLRIGGLLCLLAVRIWKYSLISLRNGQTYSSIAIYDIRNILKIWKDRVAFVT